jgi:hypothetical protein
MPARMKNRHDQDRISGIVDFVSNEIGKYICLSLPILTLFRIMKGIVQNGLQFSLYFFREAVAQAGLLFLVLFPAFQYFFSGLG